MSRLGTSKHRKSLFSASFAVRLSVLAVCVVIFAVVVALSLTAGLTTPSTEQGAKSKSTPASSRTAASSRAVAQTKWEPNPYLAKLTIAEQQESREYYRRLAEGQVSDFTIRSVRRSGKRYLVTIRAQFLGLGSQDFVAEFRHQSPQIYWMSTTQGSALASIANIGPEEEELGRRILSFQHEHQRIVRDLVNRRVSRIEIRSTRQGLDTATLDIVVHYRNGKTRSGIIEMRYVNGFWYVISVRGTGEGA